jgi:hypothetical protein
MNLLTMIRAVPATFWGIVIGSLFTVLGVMLTNASHTRRLRLQHDHERALETQERYLTMRRDIYLSAMEAISEGMGAVGRFGELDVSLAELMHAYEAKAAGIRKVALVGEQGTIQAVSIFSQELTGAFLQLSARRARLESLHEQVLAAQQRLGQSGDRAASESELATVQAAYFAVQAQLIQDSIAEVARLDGLLVPVIRLMREELDLPFDEDLHRQLVEEGHRRLAGFFADFAKEVQSAFGPEPDEQQGA